ncbi:protein halfway [Drosophila tropicalis]|uniref:protein halfway n=1 Tax=Drosophila tropicalis TaxID=46794 RepID=UPI0035ABFBE2
MYAGKDGLCLGLMLGLLLLSMNAWGRPEPEDKTTLEGRRDASPRDNVLPSSSSRTVEIEDTLDSSSSSIPTSTQLQNASEIEAQAVEPPTTISTSSSSSSSSSSTTSTSSSTSTTTTTTTTTAAPIPTSPQPPAIPEVPEYRRNCFYAEEELCLNWHDESQANPLHNDASAGASEANDMSTTTAAPNHHLMAQTNGSQLAYERQLPPRDSNSCQCREHPVHANSWYCCNITDIFMISSCANIVKWTNLHVRNLTVPALNLSNSIYRSLQSLAFTDGNIIQLTNAFPRHSPLKCLNFSNNNIDEIATRAVKDVPHLEFFGISKNNLSRVPHRNQNKNIALDISGNMRMLCEPLNEIIYDDSFNFINADISFCLYNATHQWFNSTDLVSVKQLERTKQCITRCPIIPGYGNCTCKFDRMMLVGREQSKPTCDVDCSNLGLVELPPKLPDNTFILNITNNKITSLGDYFHTNPTYHNIGKLLADNNQISSIYEFEGTKFIEHFQRIYMRNNSLSKIPEYFLNNALMDTDMGRRIYLAGNKLQCDCNSAKTLQNWLKERSTDIPDYMEIRCRNLPQSVIELQETKLCQSPPDWTDYIYYLIAAEVILLLALITKVSYDYWVFKTAGYLPWPASKMPKLPCDWLCES